MNHTWFLVVGYGITWGALITYLLSLTERERALGRGRPGGVTLLGWGLLWLSLFGGIWGLAVGALGGLGAAFASMSGAAALIQAALAVGLLRRHYLSWIGTLTLLPATAALGLLAEADVVQLVRAAVLIGAAGYLLTSRPRSWFAGARARESR